MSEKRREDSDHDIGDSSPGTVGDKETDQSNETPMDRIHKRRNGDVSVPEPTDGDEPNDQHSDKGGGVGYDEWGIPTGLTNNGDDESEQRTFLAEYYEYFTTKSPRTLERQRAETLGHRYQYRWTPKGDQYFREE